MSTLNQVKVVDRVDPVDDGQLRIRIPNPKVYMARQSQWVGRRGKPRCDYCRGSNLKCDRMLPVCNHCSWANQGDCKYTPLPTPAHRGIPRCDRCRAINLKCDRNLPICNNCKEASEVPCNYTPKKRHKGASEDDPKLSSLKISQKILPKQSEANIKIERDSTGHTFYGHNVAISRGTSPSPSFSEPDIQSDQDTGIAGRFTADFARRKRVESDLFSHEPFRTSVPVEFIPHTLPQDQKTTANNAHIEPWSHPSFISLPKFVLQRLRQLDLVEMPKRQNFDNALYAFQNGMIEALRETACLFVDKYTKLARCLNSGDASAISVRMRSWAVMHRLCSGSEKYNLILAPHDSIYSMDHATAEAHRIQFVNDFLNANSDTENLQIHHYDILPVREQLYDILTYAHRSHLPASEMLLEIGRLNYAFVTWPMAEMYVKMCPLCNMPSKQQRLSTPCKLVDMSQ
ncbi:hypothetical protein CPB84DRAFT_1710618 [Gymnopilus junonius]|uniref:Zn(2)-C6 fungal-type domain-containing protein n=1 Tax=Gymnopilus junonius TaxID=109634 RepID=A0A9P5TKW1_GYMJU|nr:hypothetical protein CPB84DRAFT_1710618 [Gymnopilus junonius]